jgi:Family of unknown function (DUF5946)
MEKPGIEKYNELAYYTLGLQDTCFIHQYIVDAYTAQTADVNTKPISLTFALVGLYLYIEKDFEGKEVQQFHTLMSNNKLNWPNFELPVHRGEINVDMILHAEIEDRKTMIKNWCHAVWAGFSTSHTEVEKIAAHYMTLNRAKEKSNKGFKQ